MIKPRSLLAGLCLAFGLGSAAQAHVTLDTPQAVTGSAYKAVFKVGHACAEARSTTAITVRLPEGFRGAQPMPKAGWELLVTRAPLAQAYEAHGRRVTEDVVEVRWQARSPSDALPAAYYDEFVLRGTVAAAPGPMWFKVRQDCDLGRSEDWAEVPASGSAARGLKAPAALLEVLPAAPAAAAAHVH
ncbi:MAG: DUF1775 domain-containing protein [Curvibacter sp.]|nr:MAG: DUF1775 domain-containing protein [Curvibacter sp.]